MFCDTVERTSGDQEYCVIIGDFKSEGQRESMRCALNKLSIELTS